MFLTDFRMRKYTGGIILRVGIFLTVTPVDGRESTKFHASPISVDFRKINYSKVTAS